MMTCTPAGTWGLRKAFREPQAPNDGSPDIGRCASIATGTVRVKGDEGKAGEDRVC